jgi:hypothetical protein
MAAETAVASGWIESFRQASDEDAELQAHGKYYTCAFVLDMEEHSYLIKMSAGKVEEILEDPGPLDARSPYVRAPRRGATSARRYRRPCTMASGRHPFREI